MPKTYAILVPLFLPALLAAQCSSVCSGGPYGPAQGASGGAEYAVCMPQPSSCYNGTMILFAHGYLAPGTLSTWESQLFLPDGTSLPTLLNGLGFGFAASSFSKDGLAILEGIQDTKALINVVSAAGIPVQKYFVTGASEGGLVATKSVEESPTSYAGGLSVCGPIGSFQKQINYFDDVRVLFDYFFPGILPGSAINTAALIPGWPAYEAAVVKAVNSNPLATLQLISTAQIEIGLDPGNAANAITSALWYNVIATPNAITTLGGNPYDNTKTVYRGSFNDARLNAMVERDTASPAALTAMAQYETTGRLSDPLVTLHTLADPVVPFWQEPLYASKVQAQGHLSKLAEIPALAYGHCNVTAAQAEAALALLLVSASR
jgi:hypothetical protein